MSHDTSFRLRSRFHAADYLEYRHEYPREVFYPLKTTLGSLNRSQILDIGAGVGLSLRSFLKFFPAVSASIAEPDSQMLQAAQEVLKEFPQVDRFFVSTSDTVPLPSSSLDIVLIGSAWHWMPYEKTVEELDRLLKPGGSVYIFEYQFPKGVPLHSPLNDWIRRQFNLEWKPLDQSPRGTLWEITETIRKHPQFSQQEKLIFTEHVSWTSDFLAGFIFSQSRFQHYAEQIPPEQQNEIRNVVRKKLADLYAGQPTVEFIIPYEGYLFKKRA